MFVRYMAKLEDHNGHQKDMCNGEIGLGVF